METAIRNVLNITPKAAQHISKIFSEAGAEAGKGLRVGVIGGGCSGLSYKIEFGERREKDNVIPLGNFEVLVDPKSAIYLKDVVLDYQDGLEGKGFVFENPNAKNTCGCGESFSV